jgi:hypothetical protein
LPHINGVICIWCVKFFFKIIVEEKNVKKNKNWLWFEIIIIFKDETLNLQGIMTLSKIHIYSKMMKKKTCHVLGQL